MYSHIITVVRSSGIMLLAMLLFVSCQTPTETPPSTRRTVTVHVEDANGKSLELIPVRMLELTDEEARPLESAVTDRSGDARFMVEIPSTGKAFRFIAGSTSTGTVFKDANLLCRDTVLVIRLATELLPCGEDVTKVLRIEDICAPLITGERFTGSTDFTFTSTCAEAISYSVTGPANSRELTLDIFDAQGVPFPARSFTIPAGGQFVVRATASPADSGVQRSTFVFNGTGPGGVTSSLTLIIEVDARNCNVCACPEEEIIVDFGFVEASPTQGRGTRTVELPLNGCRFLRIDNLVKEATQKERFGIPPIDDMQVEPGGRYTQTYSFVPAPGDFSLVQDTVLVEHFIAAENKRCTTRVILRGQGCGPACRFIDDTFVNRGGQEWDSRIHRIRIYESGEMNICFENTGQCGDLILSQTNPGAPGFSLITPGPLRIPPNQTECFKARFDAADDVVWPNGHGKPAVINHMLPVSVQTCSGVRQVNLRVLVDTLPAQFSRCIYRWDQNGNYGYNFTPVEGKGEDRYDPAVLTAQVSDIAVMSVLPGVSAQVRFRSEWKFIKANVSDAQFNFDDMSRGQNGWTLAEYRSITTSPPPFSSPGDATLLFRGVYSVRIVRGSSVFFACIRVREISVDPDGKEKVCLDVLFPMIQE